MFGAVIGDIIGSAYEFNNVKTKDFPLWTKASHITDDTVCTIAVADSILNHKPIVETLQDWCRVYSIGYSKKFQEWVNSPFPEPYQSFGNGAVMRISPVGFLYRNVTEAIQKGTEITNITHNHPMAIQAVEAYLTTMHLIKNGENPHKIKAIIQEKYPYDMNRSVDEIRATYDKFYVRCERTVPEAIICALDATSFEDAVRNAVSLGGDSDTLACMAGALAELRFGVPTEMKQKALGYLNLEMAGILKQLYQEPKRIIKHYAVFPELPAPRQR